MTNPVVATAVSGSKARPPKSRHSERPTRVYNETLRADYRSPGMNRKAVFWVVVRCRAHERIRLAQLGLHQSFCCTRKERLGQASGTDRLCLLVPGGQHWSDWVAGFPRMLPLFGESGSALRE